MSIELPPGTADYNEDLTPPTQKRQFFSVLMFFGALILTGLAIANFLLNQLILWIPHDLEKQLGALAVPIFEQLAQPSETQASLNQLLDRLEAELPAKRQADRDYQVLYLPDATVNALAIPGDCIIIYQGLLAQLESENELMMVLGHELGHFAHRDHLRGLGRGIAIQLTLAYLFGDVGILGGAIISGVETFTGVQLSQSQESQADEFALDLLNQVYGHVVGATDFLASLGQERLGQKQGVHIDLLATHPAPQKRVQRLEKLIAKRGYTIGEKSPLLESLQVRN
jgi:Zn-dependent protease with chaperone function